MPLGTEVGLGPGDIVLDGDPATAVERGTAAPPHTFRTMSIVVKRSPISATAELLFEISQLLTKLCSTFKHEYTTTTSLSQNRKLS